MPNELERVDYTGDPVAGLVPSVDSWVGVVSDVCKLAGYLADTDFVPHALRGNPAAVAAAMLSGREMGMPPMMALQHIHVIKGKPGQSAESMRAKVQAAGHEMRDVETTESRCVIEGRRRGETQWTRVTYTADQAKRARIDLGGYPEDKLYARATTRLCRRRFADVISGLPSVDELEDWGDADGETPAAIGPAIGETSQRQRRTVQRRRTPARSSGERDSTKPGDEDATAAHTANTGPVRAGEAATEGPPLPGELNEPAEDSDGGDARRGAASAAESASAEGDAQPAGAEASGVPGAEPMVTRAQLSKLHASLAAFGVGTSGHQATDRAEKLAAVGGILGRALESSSYMTRREAGAVLDTLDRLAEHDEPERALDLLLGETAAADDGTADNGTADNGTAAPGAEHQQQPAQQTLDGSE